MDADERSKYTGMTSTKKAPTKYTSFGVSFDEIERRKEDLKRNQMKMESTIDEMVTLAAEGNRKKPRFEHSKFNANASFWQG